MKRWENTTAIAGTMLAVAALIGFGLGWMYLWTWLLGTDVGLPIGLFSLLVVEGLVIGAVIDLSGRRTP